MTSSLYTGTVMHARHDRWKRAFSYPLYVASLDLAELVDPKSATRRLRLLSVNRRNLFSIDDRDYAHGIFGALPDAARVSLVTNPRVLGYTFNPVSFFIGYDAHGAITSAIAEVNNTYDGRHRYILDASNRLPDRADGAVGFRVERVFFVSPFLHGPMFYDFFFAGDLAIEMLVTHRETGARVFTARFDGAPSPLTDRALAIASIRYPLVTAKVIGLIYFEALKLHVLGAPYRRPDSSHSA